MDISDNEIGDKGAKRLQAVAQQLPHLRIFLNSKHKIFTPEIVQSYIHQRYISENRPCKTFVPMTSLVEMLETSDVINQLIPENRLLTMRQVSGTVKRALENKGMSVALKLRFRAEFADVMRDLEEICGYAKIASLHCSDLGNEGVEMILEILARSPPLNNLDPATNDVHSASPPPCQSLIRLNLGGNGIGAERAGRLAAVLGQCPSLAYLDLGGNDIGDEGAGRLAAVLGQCASLAHLGLAENRISAEGAERLAAVLGQCPSLACLDLACNGIEADGAERLAEVLGQCTSLTHLDLSENVIGDEGAESLAAVLGQCPSLAHLELYDNEIGDEGMEMFAPFQQHCTVRF